MSQDVKKPESNETIVLSPAVGIAMAGACFVSGFGWIPFALAMLVFSNAVGYYTEAKINELDRATRIKLKEATGNDQPGDSCELATLVRKTNQIAGIFCPPIPMVSLAAGLYMGWKAKKLMKLGDQTSCYKQIELAPGFDSVGRCVF